MNCKKLLLVLFGVVSLTYAQGNEKMNVFGSLGFGFGTGGQLFTSL